MLSKLGDDTRFLDLRLKAFLKALLKADAGPRWVRLSTTHVLKRRLRE